MPTNNAVNLSSAGIVKYDGAGNFSADTVTLHAALIGGSSNSITSILLTNGQLLIGSTSNDPIAATLTSSGGTVTFTPGSGSLNLEVTNAISAPVTVPQGGTGRTTLTTHGVLVGEGTSAINQLTVGTNGQVLVGSTAADPIFATLTSTGSTITYTTGSGTLNLDLTAPVTVPNGGTGRTTLTNHGVLIGAATSAITQLATGSSGQVLVSNGASSDPSFQTVPAFNQVTRQVFTTSGTYTPTAGTLYCDIEILGGGGGGGGAASSVAGSSVGGAGGAGSYARKVFPVASVTGASYIVGGGGAGATAGANTGTGGTASSFGAVMSASGGSGGVGGSNIAATAAIGVSQGGLGGSSASGLGDFASSGAPGGDSYAFLAVVVNGTGGSSIFGGGARGPSVTIGGGAAGTAAANYGSGGSGGASLADSTARAGGAGSGGIIIVTEYGN